MPEGCLDAVHVFFPDPWPKARHHKRRLVQPSHVALLRSRLVVGGVLHCATEPVLTTNDHAEIIGRTVGITVRCGEPRTSFDHLINRKVMHNREFAFGRWSFDCSALCRALGVHRFGVPLTDSEIGVIVARMPKSPVTPKLLLREPPQISRKSHQLHLPFNVG